MHNTNSGMVPKISRSFALGIAIAFQSTFCFGQTDKAIGELGLSVISDSAIHDFVSISKLDGVISKKNETLGLMQRLKRHSMESRLKHAERTLLSFSERYEKVNLDIDQRTALLSDYETRAQQNLMAFATSRASVEQLLIAAQLELQRVSWDLASEESLFEASKNQEDDAKAKERSIEREIALAEIKQLKAEQEVANQDLTIAEELRQRKAIAISEVEKAKQAVQRATNAIELQLMRVNQLEAQHAVSQANQQVESKIQIRKLRARKDQIEKNIKELFESMKSLSQREQLSARIDELEKSKATIAIQKEDLELKATEISGLLESLNEVQLIDKKE